MKLLNTITNILSFVVGIIPAVIKLLQEISEFLKKVGNSSDTDGKA